MIAAIWYDAEEYAEIKAAYQLTIFFMEAEDASKLNENPEEHTSRGLEYRTQEGAWARHENKRDAYNAVLDEQDRQWQKDVDDFDEISRIYQTHSKKCAEAAHLRALQDEKEAKEYCKSVMNLIPKPKKKWGRSRWLEEQKKEMAQGL